MIEHVGAHILCDDGLDHTAELCGFCMQPITKSGCVFYLRPTKGSGSSFQVDVTRSSCPNPVYFSYHSAASSSESAPCTNVPVACPICSPTNKLAVKNPAVWKYSMAAHLRIHHASSQLLPHLIAKYTTPQDEVNNVEKYIWQRRFHKSRKSRKIYQAPTLAVSDAHRTSRLAIESNEDESRSEALQELEAQEEESLPADDIDGDDGMFESRPSDAENGADNVLEESLDAPAFVENDVVTRAGRKSRKRDLNTMLRACDCDKVVTQKEIKDGVAIRCKYDRCETGWFHLTCMYLDHVEADWRCTSHVRPFKKAKRGGRR
ncbi:hypothetical protein CONPUDRAFT_92305 [Coniophora puteana RWD-64-598 SS2]|uniref:Zinc finger PHD-type domain-containing protein n=1 Tax=Coniophora puteana (strain RWD-64-598) TaxID=741705 RepID=A0A5M3MFR8_CONPW|nr:uncharacterized protein CONPUDRAFT_92305 [Coniophora puteana RWD-64-598 SS2]EIW78062.1 hypothetical protein CONPUDRAFT_92305 [Coniophora puteana RWD-64-598 SS2]